MAARSVAVVTAPAIRPAVARLLRAQMAELPVLSVLEIPETKTIDVIAVVGGAHGGRVKVGHRQAQ